MHVVVLHNKYRSSNPSGENSVVEDDIKFLRDSGVQVSPWISSSDEIISTRRLQRARMGMEASRSAVWGGDRQRALLNFVHERKPDIVHMHNLVPFYSPRLISQLGELGCKTVQTVHNYRRRCIKGTKELRGAICSRCSKRRTYHAVLNSCYQGSAIRAIPLALGQAAYADAWSTLDRHVVLSEFQKQWLIGQGIDARAILLKPTPARDVGFSLPSNKRLCFVGRLDAEKGIDLLLGAWRDSCLPASGWMLDVVGDGPLLEELRSRRSGPSVVFHGRLDREGVGEVMDASAAVVLPSRWLEGFPRVVSEAFARARPVLALDNPNLRTVVGECGWLVTEDLLAAGISHLQEAGDVELRARAARRRFEEELEFEKSQQKLLDMYQDLLTTDSRR